MASGRYRGTVHVIDTRGAAEGSTWRLHIKNKDDAKADEKAARERDAAGGGGDGGDGASATRSAASRHGIFSLQPSPSTRRLASLRCVTTAAYAPWSP